MDAKLAARYIASMITRTIIWYSSKGPLSLEDIAEFIYHFTMNGLKMRRNVKRVKTQQKK
jgi:hypothetical protein